jgi:predicted double-glycine peptidase
MILGAAGLLAAALIGPKPAAAGEVHFAEGVGGWSFNVPVTSLKEARFKRVTKQRYDFSCGSAAIATLMTYHYDVRLGEPQVFQEMFAAGDQKHIEKYGFSLLDMKHYLDDHNYMADGFRISLERLAKLGVPAIALIETHGYKHFVVIKGVRNGVVLLGDPARGVRSESAKKFEAQWNGIAFLIRNHAEVGKEHFNMKKDWATLGTAPYGTAMLRQSLASFTVNLKGSLPNSF